MRTTITSLSLGLLLAISATSQLVAAQDGASPSPVAEPSSRPAASLPPAGPDATVAFQEPAWKRLTPGRGPAAREDHTWTVDGDGRYAYLFGGRDGGTVFDDLWRYDLKNDSWKRLPPRGSQPKARFGHSAVWVDGQGLVVFAGQKGADFFGDLWVYRPGKAKWRKLPAKGAAPKPRYGSCMVVGRDGRLWISHGFTFAGRFDDTRAYNLKSSRWASIAPDGRRPGERCLHDCFTSASGELVLYGGQNDSELALGDLWETRRDGSWRKLADPRLAARRLYAVTEAGDDAYIFGGAGKQGPLDDLWRVDREELTFKRVKVDGAGPAARSAATLIADTARDRLVLFGGTGGGVRDDVWELVESAASPAGEAAPPSAAVAASQMPGASTAPDG